jgi:hypothetical protein
MIDLQLGIYGSSMLSDAALHGPGFRYPDTRLGWVTALKLVRMGFATQTKGYLTLTDRGRKEALRWMPPPRHGKGSGYG